MAPPDTDGIRIAGSDHVSRLLKIVSTVAAVAITAATIGLCLLSFSRHVDHFTRAGFEGRRVGGAILLTSVDREGAAGRGGLAAGDRIITADGRTAASVPQPDRSLARGPFPHRLLVEQGGEIRELLLARVPVKPDWPYVFLAFVGLLYLAIGLFTAARDRSEASRVFCAICLSSFAIYALTPAGPHDAAWKGFLLAEDLYRALLPALLLHFFLIFPRRSAGRRFLPLLYAPGLVYLLLQDGPLLVPVANAAAVLEWATRFWLFYFAIYAAAMFYRLQRLLRTPGPDAAPSRETDPMDRPRRRRRSRPVSPPLRAPAGVRPRFPAPRKRRRPSPRLHPAGLRVRDPEVAPLGRRDLRARGARDDRRRGPRRNGVRAVERTARPDARGNGGGGQERHRVRLRARPRLAPRPGEEADHRRAREDPVPRHVPRAAAPCSTSRATSRRPARARSSSRRSSSASRRACTSSPARCSSWMKPEFPRPRPCCFESVSRPPTCGGSAAPRSERRRPTPPRASTRPGTGCSSRCGAAASSSGRSESATRTGGCPCPRRTRRCWSR